MKIYTREEFMKLPIGIIFSKGKPIYFDGLMIKGQTLENDFLYKDLLWWDSGKNEKEQWKRLQDMLQNGSSYDINNTIARDGCFDDKEIFLVYEQKDLLELIEACKNAIEIYKDIK